MNSILSDYICSICILELPFECSRCCHFVSMCEVWDNRILSESRKPWTTTTWSTFHTTSLHSIPYYLLRSTKTNLYIPGNRLKALKVFIHVSKFTLSQWIIFCPEIFFMMLLDLFLFHMLGFRHNYCAGLLNHGN